MEFEGVSSLDDFEQQMQTLAHLGSFAEEFMVMSLASCLGVSVRLYANSRKDELYTLCYGSAAGKAQVHIYYVNACHYDLLMPCERALLFLEEDQALGPRSLFWHDYWDSKRKKQKVNQMISDPDLAFECFPKVFDPFRLLFFSPKVSYPSLRLLRP